MNTKEILHINGRYRTPDCELIDGRHVMIRLKTGKDIRRAEIVYNDPYIRLNVSEGLYWPYYTAEMYRSGETFDNYYFSVIIPCELHRLKYYFKLYDGSECLQYSESGFTNGYAHDDLAMFFIPYITKSNIFTPPEWISDVVWYQIMPIRFNRDLNGITEKLEYLNELGINGIYLNPVYKAHSYHKYDVIDYTVIDPELGSEEDFKRLCDKAHKLGMYVMLDISFTHCSDENPMFEDVLKNKKRSRYFKMFKATVDENGGLEYECFGMIKSMPKFETEEMSVITYFANKVVKKWMSLGVDAWRLDVANEISDSMLSEIKQVIRHEKEKTYIVGEIWHNATEWISRDALDGVTNYSVSRAILTFICDPRHDIWQYRSNIDKLLHSYTLKQIRSSMPLIDSHDTPRLRTVCGSDKDKVKVALLLLLTFFGTPSIYYGTERYMEGGGDPDNRRPANWEESSEYMDDVFAMTKLFIKLRKEHPALANHGTYEWLDHNELLIIKRWCESEELLIVINSKEYELDTLLPVEGRFINLIDGAEIGRYIHMGRLGFMVLKRLPKN